MSLPPQRRATAAAALSGIALAVGLTATSCYVVPEAPIFGYENDDLACGDGIDNDADGQIDCYDPDCLASSTVCGQIVPDVPVDEPEPNPNDSGPAKVATCRDRIDNDNDGQFDCGDVECRDIAETCCILENTPEFCSDGIDNDGNGFSDCDDFGCRQSEIVTFCDDCAIEDSVARCTDGIDNNGDGNIDCADPGCSEIWDCPALAPAPPENTVALCSDNKDNDDNCFADCDDRNCSQPDDANPEAEQLRELCNPGDSEPEDSASTCNDGKDNDKDGYADCDDFDCDPFCETKGVPEDTHDRCTDGIDNDLNGFVDCADFSCAQSPDLTVRRVCNEAAIDERAAPDQGGRPRPRAVIEDDIRQLCTNGQDEDGDGFIDCDDWDCSHNIYLPDLCDGPKVCR